MRAKLNKKSLATGLGATALLGLGLYLAVPAFADDPSPKPTASQHDRHDRRDGHHTRPGHHGKQRPWRHQTRWAARGVHGESTVRHKDGKFHVSTWQRGQVTAVSNSTVTVRSEDGTSWTWTTNDKTRVRKNAEKSKASTLAKGDQVIVRGERTANTRTATLLFVPKKR